MEIQIVTGFLGAGKTTFLNKYLPLLSGKTVVIENEFGEIGIDGDRIQEDIPVREIFAGCICCSLVGDFGKALDQVINEYAPDRILIEPSGVGKLSDVILAVERLHNDKIQLNGFTTVVDAKKAKMYMKNFGEFFNNQIEHASSIILSHTAGLSQDKLDACVALMREHNQEATIVTTPWEEITGQQILATMEQKNTIAAELAHLEEEAHDHEHHHHDHDEHSDCGHDHHHDHDHHHHDHDEHCDCGHDHHDHEHHHHDHDEHCDCGHNHHDHEHHHDHHHHHDHEGHHHADEVFTSFGVETAHKFTEKQIEEALSALSNFAEYGQVLRAKGIVEGEDGQWIHFDYVPGEPDVRHGSAAVTGMLCVIGAGIEEDSIKELFGL